MNIFKKILKILIILFIIILIILGIRAGIYAYKWQLLAKSMIINEPSIVYDTNENIIAKIGSEKNQKNVSLSELPEYLPNAYVAIEDQRFYKHSGIDLKRTSAAIFSYIFKHNGSSFGGSTITQQLVKNLTGDNSSTIYRKISEWIRAYELEFVLSKEEILESYLNIIYVGPNIYGVEMGSEYYFNKSSSKLSLAESAFLAGINNAPNSYNPFGEKDNSEKISKRTKTVLNKMLELQYIDENEYKEAILEIDKGLNFKKGTMQNNNDGIYSYHTDALLSELISDISKKENISTNFATNYIYMSGSKIYSTQNSSIQKEIEKEFTNKNYILQSKKDTKSTSQAAMIIIDHSTGYVVGCVGGLGEKNTSRGFNRATQAIRQTGSASKPLAVLAPALAKKIITPASIYTDEATTFDDGTEEGYSPIDYNNFLGNITVRRAVESSQNIPFVKIMEQLTPKKSIKFMKKMGITTLTKEDNNLNLALGGLDKGISPLEMAGAYATIANDGIYIEPTFYTKMENYNGDIVFKTKQKHKKVFSSSVSYVLKKLLTQPVLGTNGTAVYCKINGIDVAAKTGTTNENFDRWLCGFTPYYTAVTWYGFDISETIDFNGKNPAGLMWADVMKKTHSKLKNATFERPILGVEEVKICPTSGLLAEKKCKNTYTEYFVSGTSPKNYCDVH